MAEADAAGAGAVVAFREEGRPRVGDCPDSDLS
jgi:hypothetical protein